MKKIIACLLILLLRSLLVAQTDQTMPIRPIVVRNVTVINMVSEKPESNMTVLVSGNWIAEIGKNPKIPKDAEIIDARGKFLIPGLWDMHVHTLFEGRTPLVFPMYIANGITGIRDMGGPMPLEQATRIRREIEEGRILGPRLGALTGKLLDGPRTPIPIANVVATAAEGRQIVKSLKAEDADFIKVYDLLPREAFLAIAVQANREKIPFLGHVPFSVTAAEASDLGIKSIEHNTDVLIYSSQNEAELRKELRASTPALSNQSRNHIEAIAVDSYDERKAADLFDRFVRNGTWLCPTNMARKGSTFSDVAEIYSDSRMKYIPPAVKENWGNIFYQRFMPIGSLEQRQKRYQKNIELAGAMRRAGVKILAGTDTSFASPLTFAGFTLHDELATLVEGGFTPFQALQTATVNPAQFLGLKKSLGTIEKGKLADLVLLDANPLANIANTKRINAVVLNGRFLDRKTLDKILAEVEIAAKKR